jgi:hypothetical protein
MKKLFVLLSLCLVACGSGAASYFPGVQASAPVTIYTITPTADANGTISPSGATQVNSGGSQAFAMSCNSGYYLTAVTVDGGAAAVTTPYTFTNVTTNHAITFTCSVVVAGSSEETAILAQIASTQSTWASTAMLGTVYYFCDCGTSHASGCVAGNDSNDGLTTSTPKQTITAAMTLFNSMAANSTVALCKGGAFDTTLLSFGTARCSLGSTCDDLREFSPTTFSSSAKPIINLSSNAANGTLNFDANNRGGVRILNISLKGAGNNNGIFMYDGGRDVTIGNVDMSDFNIAAYVNTDVTTNHTKNFTFTGNTITNSRAIGFLGGAADGTNVNYNSWVNNGSNSVLNHTLYLSSAYEATNFNVIGNHITGQYGASCTGSAVEGHGEFNGLMFKNNYVSIDPSAATSGCWGIDLDNVTNATYSLYYKNSTVSGNTVIAGGNSGILIDGAVNLILENNLVIQNWPSGGANGITIPGYAAQSGRGDLVTQAATIRNNTVWFGPNATGPNVGINVAIEGTSHIVSNNTISSTQASGSLTCFNYALALTSYAFINNNDCYASSVTASWEHSYSTLAAWQSHATAYGFDSASVTGNPSFTGIAGGNAYSAYLQGRGNHTNASILGFDGDTRANPPAIGAREQ